MSNNILWIPMVWKAVSERLHLSMSVNHHQRTKFYDYKIEKNATYNNNVIVKHQAKICQRIKTAGKLNLLKKKGRKWRR